MTRPEEDPDIRSLWILRQLEEIEQRLDHLLLRVRSLDLRIPDRPITDASEQTEEVDEDDDQT